MLNEPLEDYLRIIRSGAFNEEEYQKLLKELDVDIHTDCITDSGKNLSNGQRKKLLMIKLLLYCKEASIHVPLNCKNRHDYSIGNTVLHETRVSYRVKTVCFSSFASS